MRDLCWSLEVRVKKEKHFVDIIKTIVGCLERFEIDFNWMKSNNEILYEQE